MRIAHVIKVIRLSVLAVIVTLAVTGISQLFYSNQHTFAATTLTGNNEVIQVATTDGQPPNAPVNFSTVSKDGNVILFGSQATNLPHASNNNAFYAYNIRTNTSTRLDMSTSGVPANQSGTLRPAISENGRYVFFQSYATNLIDGTVQYDLQLYLRDLQLGTITAVTNSYSTSSQNYVPQRTTQDFPIDVSNDGRFILIGSRYTGVGYPNFYNIVLGDKKTGTFVWTSLAQSNGGSGTNPTNGAMSCDGSLAVYEKSGAIYSADTRNSTPSISLVASGPSVSGLMSCNGVYILYATTNRSTITPNPLGANNYMHLVRYNRITGERQYIDSNSSGVFDTNTIQYNGDAYIQPANLFNASISDSGDAVLKYNGSFYLKHLSDGSGTLEPIGKVLGGSYVNITTRAQITADGRYIFFAADPYDLSIGSSPMGNQIIRTKTNL